jgi:LPXTG-motif cell wall-anchored protein
VNLLKSRFRRSTAVAAGVFLGLAGAVALVSPASAHTPSVTGSKDCVQDGKWTIDWSIGNDYKTDATLGKISVDHGTVTGPITQSGKIIPAYSSNKPEAQVHGTTTVDDTVSSVTINVWLQWRDYSTPDNKPASYQVRKPENCKPTTPPTTPPATVPPTSPPATPGEPTPTLTQDCTTITIGLVNPKNGNDVTLKFETKKGEVRTTVIKPGETKSEKFSATPGFYVDVTPTGIAGASKERINYEQPADCDTSGSGGGLPVTGAAAGTIAGGAGLLLVVGAVLFVMSRRRKVKFTA